MSPKTYCPEATLAAPRPAEICATAYANLIQVVHTIASNLYHLQILQVLDVEVVPAAVSGKLAAQMTVQAVLAHTTLGTKPMCASHASTAWCWLRMAAVVRILLHKQRCCCCCCCYQCSKSCCICMCNSDTITQPVLWLSATRPAHIASASRHPITISPILPAAALHHCSECSRPLLECHTPSSAAMPRQQLQPRAAATASMQPLPWQDRHTARFSSTITQLQSSML
jgi:hypothetical protein